MASVSEPFLLAIYAQPKRVKSTSTSYTNTPSSSCYASQPEASSSKYVTVAASGNGVHVLDTSTLHPAISHTLGPQVTFTCPAVSHTSLGERKIATYAVIDFSHEIKADERARTVWRWEDDPSGSGTASEIQKSKRTAIFPHRIFALHRPESLPEHLILVGDGGEITLTDADLNTKASHQPEDDGETIIHGFLFDRHPCSFVPTRKASRQGAIVVLLTMKTKDLNLRVYSIGTEGAIIYLSSLSIAGIQGTNVLDVSCSTSGFLSILESNGVWHSFQLESPDQISISITTVADSIHLRGLTAIRSSQDSSHTASHPKEISLISLTASHVLLAGVTTGSSPEVIFLLWDLQYSVLLASYTMNIPSSLSRTKKQGIQIQLVGGKHDHDQAVLILSPLSVSAVANGVTDATPVDSNARSSVYVVPLVVPRVSTIANAMGRASVTAKWVGQPDSQAELSVGDVSQVKLLNVIRTLLDQKRADAADEAFFQWVAGQGSKAQQQSPYGHRFVQQLLEIIFRQPKGSNANSDIPYSPKIVRYLLEKKVVTSGMLETGLLPALTLRRDWDSILSALTSVVDIPEGDIVAFLRDTIVAQQKQQLTSGEGAMEVDSAPGTTHPSLSSVLSLVVTYPSTAPAMRVAIRRHLKDAEDSESLLDLIAQWVEVWCSEDLKLFPEQAVKDERGVLVPVLTSKARTDIPPLEKVLAFFQILLDSSFLTFLSHPPSHRHIRQIFTLLEPELAFNNNVEQLRGALEPFAKAHAKATSDALHGPQKQDPKVDWRKKKKAAHERAAITIGLYQVEELVL